LRWLGHVECQDDSDLVTLNIEGLREDVREDAKDDMEKGCPKRMHS